MKCIFILLLYRFIYYYRFFLVQNEATQFTVSSLRERKQTIKIPSGIPLAKLAGEYQTERRSHFHCSSRVTFCK